MILICFEDYRRQDDKRLWEAGMHIEVPIPHPIDEEFEEIGNNYFELEPIYDIVFIIFSILFLVIFPCRMLGFAASIGCYKSSILLNRSGD